MTSPLIAFNTANLVGRVTGYRFKLDDWGKQEKLTIQRTDPAEFAAICGEIARCGYSAVELWQAHCHPSTLTEARAAEYRQALASNRLTPVSLAAAMTDDTARVCRMLGIPAICGGYWGSDRETSTRVMRSTGVLYNFENHGETSVDEIRNQVANGADGLAVALDTGWLGTQGMDAPATVRQLGRLIRHVHLKDVKAAGGHHTVKLGSGCVDIPGAVRELKSIGYTGVLSWEDEPEDRNPFDIAAEMRQYILRLWNG